MDSVRPILIYFNGLLLFVCKSWANCEIYSHKRIGLLICIELWLIHSAYFNFQLKK